MRTRREFLGQAAIIGGAGSVQMRSPESSPAKSESNRPIDWTREGAKVIYELRFFRVRCLPTLHQRRYTRFPELPILQDNLTNWQSACDELSRALSSKMDPTLLPIRNFRRLVELPVDSMYHPLARLRPRPYIIENGGIHWRILIRMNLSQSRRTDAHFVLRRLLGDEKRYPDPCSVVKQRRSEFQRRLQEIHLPDDSEFWASSRSVELATLAHFHADLVLPYVDQKYLRNLLLRFRPFDELSDEIRMLNDRLMQRVRCETISLLGQTLANNQFTLLDRLVDLPELAKDTHNGGLFPRVIMAILYQKVRSLLRIHHNIDPIYV